MSRDRFITFGPTRAPNKEEVEKIITGYGPDFFKSITWVESQRRFLLTLPGVFEKYNERRVRLIEVVMPQEPLHMDVLTREMDTLTNDVADGLARVIARQWLGTCEDGDFATLPSKFRVSREQLWAAVEKANNILFDTHDSYIEHTIHSHFDSPGETYRKVAKGAADALEALQEVIREQVGG